MSQELNSQYFIDINESIADRDIKRFTRMMGLAIDKTPGKIESKVLLKWLVAGAFNGAGHIVLNGLNENFYTLAFKFVKEMLDAYPERFDDFRWGEVNNEFIRNVRYRKIPSEVPYHYYPLELLSNYFDDYDINAPGEYRVTTLMAVVAAEYSKADDIEMILSMGADVHRVSAINGKALHFVDMFQDDGEPYEKMITLLMAGADPSEKLSFNSYAGHTHTHNFVHETSFLNAIQFLYNSVKRLNMHNTDKPIESYISAIKRFTATQAADKHIESSVSGSRKGVSPL